jgi:A/G-specific adenine glycosylase
VLVSEFMLQQTQVDRVAPRFVAFIARFPCLEALAAASEQEVLAVWSGLGYYSRARHLHRLARDVVADGGGLPRTTEELQRLPGVGPYTAAAVASLAFGAAVPVVDGNVSRVVARVLALKHDLRTLSGGRIVTDWVRGLFEGVAAGAVNEALMELGATVCRPRAPRCGDCPLAHRCRANADGTPEAYPRARRSREPVHLRWVAACCVDDRDRWLLRQMPEGPILQGLWLPPLAEIADGVRPVERALELAPLPLAAPPMQLSEVRHSITHRRILVHPVLLRVVAAERGLGGRWIDPSNHELPTSSLLEKLLATNGI